MLAAADVFSAFPKGWSPGTARPHLLFIGPLEITEAALETLLPQLHPPVLHWDPGTALPTTGTPTIVIHHAARISLDQQREWVSWLDQQGPGRPQLVTTSDTSLFALVEQGRFLDVLYYRLNTIIFGLAEPAR